MGPPRSRTALCLGLALFLASTLLQGPALAQLLPVGVVTTLDGQATVVRAGQSQTTALKFKANVFLKDRVKTEQGSLVKILLGGKALLTAGELSELTVAAESATTVTTLHSGKVAVNMIKAKLKPGDNFEIRAPNAVVQVRGSTVVVEVRSGTTDVDCGDGNSFVAAAGNAVVECPQGQGFTITGNILGPIRPIRPDAMAKLEGKRKPDRQAGGSSIAVALLAVDGKPVPLDPMDPKYGPYVEQLREFIAAKWGHPCLQQDEKCEFKATELDVEFSIAKDGRLAYINVMRASSWKIYEDYLLGCLVEGKRGGRLQSRRSRSSASVMGEPP